MITLTVQELNEAYSACEICGARNLGVAKAIKTVIQDMHDHQETERHYPDVETSKLVTNIKTLAGLYKKMQQRG